MGSLPPSALSARLRGEREEVQNLYGSNKFRSVFLTSLQCPIKESACQNAAYEKAIPGLIDLRVHSAAGKLKHSNLPSKLHSFLPLPICSSEGEWTWLARRVISL